MANPQKENGFTPLANEILDRLCLAGITGSEYRVLLLVIRKTYGFHKKQDFISLTQFQKGTLMNRVNAVRTIQSLVAKRILVKEGSVYRFNKNWEEWVVAKRLPSSQTTTTPSSQLTTKTSSRLATYKRNKEIDTKERESGANAPEQAQYGNPDINEVIGYLKESVPLLDGSQRENRQYAKLLLDKVAKVGKDPTKSVDAVKFIINSAVQSSFHSKNATSMKYLYYHAGSIIQNKKGQSSKVLEVPSN